MQQDAAKIGIAFALVLLAGLCAPLGACVVLFMRTSHTHLLALSIALAAGVMLFVSLTEVLRDSTEEIKQTGWASPLVNAVTYLAFFGGVVMCRILDLFTDGVMKLVGHHKDSSSSKSGSHTSHSRPGNAHAGDKDSSRAADALPLHETARCQHSLAHRKAASSDTEADGSEVDLVAVPVVVDMPSPAQQGAASNRRGTAALQSPALLPDEAVDHVVLEAAEHLRDDNCAHLARTCVLVWLALSLHNLPEGLATFVGYMASPHLGITVAVAIAIHNIPEGIALGVPIYFATGSKLKAIGWTAVSGMAEPLGALIGLAVQLGGRLNPVAMGIIMAMVAGIMTGIALQELLPRAMAFDPSHRYSNYGMFTGMAIMAVSLVLLSLMDPAA